MISQIFLNFSYVDSKFNAIFTWLNSKLYTKRKELYQGFLFI